MKQKTKQIIERYVAIADRFGKGPFPSPPSLDKFRLKAGWVRYTPDGKTRTVEFPLEEAFVFDTETFNTGTEWIPVIASAVSLKAIYVWLAPEFCSLGLPKAEWEGQNLIPLPRDSFIIGHNISYDRIRSSIDYNLDPEISNFWFDTLSAHTAVAGFNDKQRTVAKILEKPTTQLTDSQRHIVRNTPDWYYEGSLGGLPQAFNFHVAKPSLLNLNGESPIPVFNPGDKKIREAFENAKSMDELARRKELILYCVKDSYYTAQLFQELWPKYKEATPTYIGLASQYYLNSSKIPVTPEWHSWVKYTDKIYEDLKSEASQIVMSHITKCVTEWQKALQQDIDSITPDIENLCEINGVKYYNQSGKPKELGKVLNLLRNKKVTDWQTRSKEFASKDWWLSQLDWTVKSFDGMYKNLPVWACEFIAGKKIPTLYTKMLGLLLKMEWNGQPVTYSTAKGYGYGLPTPFTPIPHPDGKGGRVTLLFSKEFSKHMEVGRLSSALPEAQKIMEISRSISTWTSVRDRVKTRVVRNNIFLPEIIAHGTLTRRTKAQLVTTLCATKEHKVGTELKSRIQAPPGYAIVGADFDQEEIQIAELYARVWNKGKPTKLSEQVKAGDIHTDMANQMGVTRQEAKPVNFAILYGGGAKVIVDNIMKNYPDKDPQEVARIAKDSLAFLKGVKNEKGQWVGGVQSEAFNTMEALARGDLTVGRARQGNHPCLPVLGTRITGALHPTLNINSYKPSIVNWTIQCSGSEILAIFLTKIHDLAAEASIPIQFLLSIHDELFFMVKEDVALEFAKLMQKAHLATWELFQDSLGMGPVPAHRRYFSGVSIDNRIRKSPTEKTTTVSHDGSKEPDGQEFSASDLGLV